MGANIVHYDRRGLAGTLTPEELSKLGVEGLMLLDLRLCRRDSEVIIGDKNLPGVVAWLPEGAERSCAQASYAAGFATTFFTAGSSRSIFTALPK